MFDLEVDLKLKQADRLLELLKKRHNKGVMVYEIIAPRPQGLGIAQYTARIFELRHKGFNIVNEKLNVYVLHDEPHQIELF